MGGYCQQFDVEHPVSDPTYPYASTPSGPQPPYGQQPQCAQAPYGQQQYGYGQPVAGQLVYGQYGYAPVDTHRYDNIRTFAIVALILSIVSWFTYYLFQSVPVMIWAIVLARKARADGVPPSVRSAANSARIVSIIMVLLQALLVVVAISILVFYPH